MLEKIEQIQKLLVVPNVDKHPKIAINQMKILNLLVELRAEVEQCTIPDVIHWVAHKDADFLKHGEDYLVSKNDYVTVDTWIDDGLGFLKHFDEVMVAKLPKPPCV